MEKISNRQEEKDSVWTQEKPIFHRDECTEALSKLSKISSLPESHAAKQYVVRRQIPSQYHAMLRWCPNFMNWTNILKPNQFQDEHLKFDEGRVLIPFFDKKGVFYAYQGRAISQTKQRYITIVLNYDTPRVFGLDTVDVARNVYVFEGPIDAMFINNSVASGGHISELLKITTLDKPIIIYDNEPRSVTTKQKIISAIEQGFRVCIWPSSITSKDINEMVLQGYSPAFLEDVINTNTYAESQARAHLAQWSKV